MKTILVPTDFSNQALNALKVAARIARKINARINLVHVYNIPSATQEAVLKAVIPCLFSLCPED